MIKIFKATLITFVALLFSVQVIFAQAKVFTAEELSQYNGKDGAKAYTSYEGIIYDVTGSEFWELGEHYGLQAGKDLTEELKNAPHGPEVLKNFPVMGTLEGYQATKSEPESDPEAKSEPEAKMQDTPDSTTGTTKAPWFSKRIRIAGISILGWTGILLGVFFVLTFATCFALPWAKLKLPWTGSKIGHDPLDESGTHLVWSSIHKYFVWITVILGIIHGILGFLQMMGIYL